MRETSTTGMRRGIAAVAGGLAAVAMLALPRDAAALDPNRIDGHVALGYSQLFIPDSPGGSLSIAAGIDVPLVERLSAGARIGFALLGSRALEEGSAVANLDYSAFEAALMLHWVPDGWGPIGRVGVGPALVSARAELSTSGGGIAFTPEAIEEVAPGVAFDLTLMSTRPSPVRAGIQLGVVHAFGVGPSRPIDDPSAPEPDQGWTIGSIRLAIHY